MAFGEAVAQEESILAEVVPNTKKEARVLRHLMREYRYGKRGYYGSIEASLCTAIHNTYGFEVVNGYRFNPWVAVGGGIGVRYAPQIDRIGVPLYAHVRVDLLDRRVTPYITYSCGFSIFNKNYHEHELNEVESAGIITVTEEGLGRVALHAELSVGVSVRFKGGKQINLGIGSVNRTFSYTEVEGGGGVRLHLGFVW